jgi:outer membrane lipoprotein-sorting protein
MTNNDLLDDDVLHFILDESDDARQPAVRKAIAENAELAAVAQRLKTAVAAVRAENVGQVGDDFNDRLRRRMLEVSDGVQADNTRPTLRARPLVSWRRIMRHRVSAAVAATLFMFAITGVALWFHGSGATYAFADFVAPILEAKTVRYKVTVEMKGSSAVTATGEEMVLDRTRSRSEMRLSNGAETVRITDWGRGKSLSLDAAAKRATVLTFTNMPKNVSHDPSGWIRLLQMARDSKTQNLQTEPLGEKEIDGRRLVGFRVSGDRGEVNDAVTDLWGDPKTGMPVRAELTTGMDGNLKTTFSDFVFNVDMDESLFSVEPPPGYTVDHQEADVSENEEQDLIEMFREYCQVAGGSFPDSLDLMTASRAVWVKHTIQIQWEALTSQIGKGNDEQRRRFEELTFRTLDGKQDEEQMRKIRRETLELTDEMTWENLAPEKVRANVEVRRKFVELMLKTAEGKPTEAQAGDLKEEIRKLGGDELWEAMQTHERARKTAEADKQKTAEAQEAQTRRFMEAQQRVQRGLHFANQLPPNADAHYVGKGVLLGAVDTPVFWYSPKDTKKYRVIYADLSVRDADAPPNVPQTPPVGR